MKEILFIRQNIEKWKSMEKIIDDVDLHNPAELAAIYTEITTDLSFSRSHYPSSRITLYINNLASALHNQLYKKKKEKYSRLLTFWTREIPDVMYQSRKELMFSCIIFIVSILIGIVSTRNDETFSRLIMGDAYIDMTLHNIENGNPMAVYSNSSSLPMFIQITLNNIKVSFLIFVYGIFSFIGVGWILFRNGVMIGAFQTFMFQYDVGFESMLAIWQHGTFEISAIIVAGSAGCVLGNGWIFPGTYPRGYAFRTGAKRGLKIIAGLIPIFIVAGFIESYLTRHVEYHTHLRLSIILLSFAAVVYYYVLLPFHLHNAKIKK